MQLTAGKTLENRALESGEFRFLVYESNESYRVAVGAEPFRVATNASAAESSR